MESSSEFLLLFNLPEQTKSRQRRQVPRSPRRPGAAGVPHCPRPPPPPTAATFRLLHPSSAPTPSPAQNFPRTEPPREKKKKIQNNKPTNNLIQGGVWGESEGWKGRETSLKSLFPVDAPLCLDSPDCQ